MGFFYSLTLLLRLKQSLENYHIIELTELNYTFYDYEGIFISASINSIAFNNDNYSYYPSLYSIRVSDKYIIKSFSIMASDSGGNNISNNGDNLNIIICYI